MFQVAFASWLVVLALAAAQATPPLQPLGKFPVGCWTTPRINHLPMRACSSTRSVSGGGRPASTMTNQDGEFAFTGLQPGSYRLGTNKLGFFPTPDVGMPLVTLAGPGEQVNIDLTMSKGGTLAGRVLDQAGRPLKNVWVGALRVVGLAELEQAIPSVSVARTNDVGEYRVESLQAWSARDCCKSWAWSDWAGRRRNHGFEDILPGHAGLRQGPARDDRPGTDRRWPRLQDGDGAHVRSVRHRR